MVKETSPSLAYHYWLMCINKEGSNAQPTPNVLVKGTDFDPKKDIGREDDEGHTGTATTKISTYRKEATSTPSFKDKCRYKEGWEDVLYLLTGSDDGSGNINKTKIVDGVYKYVFSENPNSPKEPALATLINGFSKSENDAFLYLDALLNTFKLSGTNTEIPVYEIEFDSDFPHFHQQNPARVFPKKSIYPKAGSVRIYVAPQGGYASLDDIRQYEYSCYEDWEVNINKNVEGNPCSNDDFGTSTKVVGITEGDFKMKLPWNSKTKNLEYEFMGGDSDLSTTVVTDEETHKTVWIVMTGSEITYIDNSGGTPVVTDTGKFYQTIFKLPDVVLTKVDSPQSGTDAKTLDVESDIVSNGIDPFVEIEVTTGLENLHISTT